MGKPVILGITYDDRQTFAGPQLTRIGAALQYFRPTVIHLGDTPKCRDQVFGLVRKFAPKCVIVCHPWLMSWMRGNQKGDKILPGKDFYDRDCAIIDSCGVLLATPHGARPQRHTPFWEAICYGISRRKQIYVIYSNGSAKRLS